jgi:hypothetical protein
LAPQWLAEELLHSEGFSEVEYVGLAPGATPRSVLVGQADLGSLSAPGFIPGIGCWAIVRRSGGSSRGLLGTLR